MNWLWNKIGYMPPYDSEGKPQSWDGLKTWEKAMVLAVNTLGQLITGIVMLYLTVMIITGLITLII